jgi:hypothetical protein
VYSFETSPHEDIGGNDAGIAGSTIDEHILFLVGHFNQTNE